MELNKYSVIKSTILIVACTFVISCSTIDQTQQTSRLGSTAGGSIGAIIGKRAGNAAIGATIGAAWGATTGSFIGKRLDYLTQNKNTPLYIIDGVKYKANAAHNKLATIPTDNIENITVLKHKEATALYGSKGEHGAILISLKKI